MRLKTFQAQTMSEAMKLVRDELGDDAIIVSTAENGGDGVRITAAIEVPEPEFERAPLEPSENPLDIMVTALDRHGVPRELADRTFNTALLLATSEVIQTFAGVLDLMYEFSPIVDEQPTRPLMLVGPAGCGKTSAIAKLAAQFLLQRKPVTLITTDLSRAGAIAQIEAYGEKLRLAVKTADGPEDLAAALDATAPDHIALIDTTGTNPYDLDDMTRLIGLAGAAPIDPVLVLDAGRDAVEAARLATEFRKVAPRRLLMTGLDLVHRLGAILTAADACQAALCEFSATPVIANGLQSVNPVSLARLLLEKNRLPTVSAKPQCEPPHLQRKASGWN